VTLTILNSDPVMTDDFSQADSDRRLAYLAAMGITVWERRDPSALVVAADAPAPAPANANANANANADTLADASADAPADALAAPGEPLSQLEPTPEPVSEPVSETESQPPPGNTADAGSAHGSMEVSPAESDDVSQLGWEALRARVSACTRCPLHASRTQTVFGVGDRQASVLVVGEAPGSDEDRLGEPFVGPSGQLLDKMLQALGLSRETVYITNIVKSRPPDNRNPRPGEAAACLPYLHRQIALLQPKLILALGKVSAEYLLGSKRPLRELRTTVQHFGDGGIIPVVVSYHPAYLLRRPGAKAQAWHDLKTLRSLLERS